jgi:membrane protein
MGKSLFSAISLKGVHSAKWKPFFKDLLKSIKKDDLGNGAAAVAYYAMLALFPAMIFILSLLPYLPIENLQESILSTISQALPGETFEMLQSTILGVVAERRGGLLSFGALFTLYSASTGMYQAMMQLNRTYHVSESRSFIKGRGTALLLTIGLGLLVIASVALIMAGESFENWVTQAFHLSAVAQHLITVTRWVIIAVALTLGLAITYYFGPDVEQDFRFITPGSVIGVLLLIGASLLFKYYVENFATYNKTYGSLGAVIVLMLWLNLSSFVILIGSEINAMIEHYDPEGKDKGEKEQPDERPARRGLHRLRPSSFPST